MEGVIFILYVANQEKSRDFYQTLFDLKPSIDVPGMTEFTLSNNIRIGLMPEDGIYKILEGKTYHPNTGSGIPRCEIYLRLQNVSEYIKRASTIGVKEISPLQKRNWGETVVYYSDLDGHIIAFAERNL